jgi:hypothetical protein
MSYLSHRSIRGINIIKFYWRLLEYAFKPCQPAMGNRADTLRSMGMSEYRKGFIVAGFWTWDDLLNITEAEL